MRNGTLFLSLVVAALILFFVVLPVLGFILLVVVGVLTLAVVAYLAAPLLAKLPWFRDRIHVEEHGGRRTVRFGRAVYSTYRHRPEQADPFGSRRPHDDDVIDVEGRELPEKRDEQ
ncbi:MAG: hypothetical protein ACOY94_26490 [Bacillota bacterium]